MSTSLHYAPAATADPATPNEPDATHGSERLQLLRCMLADRDWSHDPLVRTRLERVAVQLRSPAGASIDEASWTLLADETASYLDYRRLRGIEAQLRGCARDALHYTRADWEASRVVEAALHAHHRQARDGSYVPAPAPLFRIH